MANAIIKLNKTGRIAVIKRMNLVSSKSREFSEFAALK
jgi:hypothetical protein